MNAPHASLLTTKCHGTRFIVSRRKTTSALNKLSDAPSHKHVDISFDLPVIAPHMNLPARCLTTLLALLALAGAQVFGLQRGYLCECNGEVVETSSQHCHVSGDHTTSPCDVPLPHGDHKQGDTEEHAPLKLDLMAQASGGGASSSAIGFVAIAPPLADLPAFLSLVPVPDTETAATQVPLDASVHAATSIQVARCMVLLV